MISKLEPAVDGVVFPLTVCGIVTVWLPLTRRVPVHLPFLSSCFGRNRRTSARNMLKWIPDPLPEARHDAVAGFNGACVSLTPAIRLAPVTGSMFVSCLPRNITQFSAPLLVQIPSQYKNAPMTSALSGTPLIEIVPVERPPMELLAMRSPPPTT